MTSDQHTNNEKDGQHKFDGRIENRATVLQLVGLAHQQVRLFTPDLEKYIYDQDEIIQAFNQLALRSKQTQIRVLVRDPDPAVKSGHRLIELCRRHSSSIFLHRTPADTEQIESAYLLIDDIAYLYKNNGSLYSGNYNTHDKLKVRELGKRFDEAWERSQAEPEMRRLFI